MSFHPGRRVPSRQIERMNWGRQHLVDCYSWGGHDRDGAEGRLSVASYLAAERAERLQRETVRARLAAERGGLRFGSTDPCIDGEIRRSYRERMERRVGDQEKLRIIARIAGLGDIGSERQRVAACRQRPLAGGEARWLRQAEWYLDKGFSGDRLIGLVERAQEGRGR